ncbi:MAG: glycosyltransferase family A protein [Hyphomicrobiales bacterium]
MRISAIIPVRNGEAYIRDAIRSIEAQPIKVAEIHVVNDRSTDGTQSILEDLALRIPALRLHEGPARGPGAARNVGLKAASGNVIAFLDSDDLWPPDKLERQLVRLAASPQVAMVSGFVTYFDKQDEIALAPAQDSRINDLFHVHLGASVYRREVFDMVGIFDEAFLYSEDVDLMLRIREAKIPITILRDITLFYRRHSASMTSTLTMREKQDFNRALMNSLRRRKATGEVEPLAPFRSLVGV